MIKIMMMGGLGAPKEDEHNQNHNKEVGPTSDDNH